MRSTGPLIKPEPVYNTASSPKLPHRQGTTPCPTTLAGDDTTMMDTATLHPNFHQELLDASLSRSTPQRPTAPTPLSLTASSTPTPRDIYPQDGALFDERSMGERASIDVLGQRIKTLVQGMDKLQQLGVETAELPLPKIVVVGDQSAGKSSLVEGISGIKVPRSSGTCTRCPLQVTLTPSANSTDRWACKISLQKKYSCYSSPGVGVDASPYGKWYLDDVCSETYFTEVYNPDALEDALRRAQIATLNPGANPQQYLIASNVDLLQAKEVFSPNPVRLDISGPGLPALSFFDLPGVINQTEEEEDHWLVSLVQNLVKEYIQQENSLILLACSMENDLQNSSASALVARCKGANDRTVAVLTKPDRFPVGNPSSIIQKILENKSFRVGHGYFVTKQPSQMDLEHGITNEQARITEAGFFAAHPWATDFAAYKERFGTAKLREALSHKLTDQILASLPNINYKIDLRLSEVEHELGGYPDPPENALQRVLEALTKFINSVNHHIQGLQPYNQLRNTLRGLAAKFEMGLRKQRPTLLTATPAGFDKTVVNLISDDEESDNETATTRAPTPMEVTTPAKKRKLESTTVTPFRSIKSQQQSQQGTLSRPAAPAPEARKMSLLDIRRTLESLSLSDVPNEIDHRAVDHLRSQSLAGWNVPMEMFLDRVAETLQVTFDRLLQDACEQWLATDLYKEAKQIVRAFISATIEEQRSYARRAFSMECYKPSTMNQEGVSTGKERENKILTEARTSRRALEHLKKTERQTRVLNEDELKKKESDQKRKAENDQKLRAELPTDPFQREVEVMASIRGYYDVALLRFLDHVVLGVQAEALAKCRTELPAQLEAGLMVESAEAQEHCTRLLAENAEREDRRLCLKREREKLLEAQKWLAGLRDAGF